MIEAVLLILVIWLILGSILAPFVGRFLSRSHDDKDW
jgi:hypothetical protein